MSADPLLDVKLRLSPDGISGCSAKNKKVLRSNRTAVSVNSQSKGLHCEWTEFLQHITYSRAYILGSWNYEFFLLFTYLHFSYLKACRKTAQIAELYHF